jgi:iron complex outermembrane receptor protein
MERIEVVKGPQATLFGTAAEVGAVSMISAKPKPGFAAELNGSYGNFQRTQLSGFVNAGDETLAGRLAFSHKYRHGYTRNIQPGQDDLNGEDDWGGRASLRWRPTAKFTLDAVFTYDRQRDPGTGFVSLIFPTTAGTKDPFGITQLSGSPYSASVLGNSKLGINRDVYDANITARLDLAPGISFTTVNGYRKFSSQEVFDADGSRAPYLEFAEDARGEQFSHESRFAIERQHWRATAGWNVFVENSFQKVPFASEEGTYLACTVSASLASIQGALTSYFGIPSGASCANGAAVATGPTGVTATAALLYLGAGVPLGTITSLPYASVYTNKGVNAAYSAFADATYMPTPKLELTAGARLLVEHRKSEYNAVQPNSVLTGAPLLPLADTRGQIFATSANYVAVLPRFNALYRAAEGINLYATVSEGRRSPVLQLSSAVSGGVAVPVLTTIPAETVWNVEGGIKARAGKLSGTFSVFYQLYDGFQVSVSRDGKTVTESAGSAHNPGMELDGTYAFSPNVALTGSVGYLKGRIDSTAANGTYAGNQFRLTPDWTGSLALDVRIPLAKGMTAYVAPNWNYRSKVYFEMPNLEPISQQAYSLYNLRAGFDFAQKRYSLGGFVRNIGNRHYLLDAGNTGGSFGNPTYIAGEPRMYGLEASAKF